MNAKEVLSLIEDYESGTLFDEESEDYNQEWEDEGIRNVWDYFEYDTSPAPLDIPGLGLLEKVESGTALDQFGDKYTFVIVKAQGRTFQMRGWYDSWGGDSGWDGPFTEVEQVPVTTMEWKQVENG